MKLCKTCQQSKPESEFSKNKNIRDRLQSPCKACQHASQTQWYKKNPTANREQCGKYYNENRHKWRIRSYKNTYGLTLEKWRAVCV